jgi:hypothetical protein
MLFFSFHNTYIVGTSRGCESAEDESNDGVLWGAGRSVANEAGGDGSDDARGRDDVGGGAQGVQLAGALGLLLGKCGEVCGRRAALVHRGPNVLGELDRHAEAGADTAAEPSKRERERERARKMYRYR